MQQLKTRKFMTSEKKVVITYKWKQNILLEFYFQVFECICMCIFYRLCIVLGSHLLFIRHHMRSSWPLGLKLLEGRNILRVPEGMLPCVPGSTTTSPWVNFYTPILYWAHLRVTGPGILCLCLPDRKSVV